MSQSGRARLRALVVVAVGVLPACGCRGGADPARMETMEARRPAAEIIEERAPEWMALPGVVGVYESRTAAGEACLKVMVKRETPELRRRIPESVDGYPVLLRETGPVAPRGEGD